MKVTERTPWQCILDHYYNDNGNSTGNRSGKRIAYLANSPGDGLLQTASASYNLDGSVSVSPLPGGMITGYWSPGQRHLFGFGDNGFGLVDLDMGSYEGLSPSLDFGIDQISWAPVGNTLNDSGGLIVAQGVAGSGFSFSDLITMTSNGDNITDITNDDAGGLFTGFFDDPSFSSDGKKIAAVWSNFEGAAFNLVTMNSDGSNLTPFLSTPGAGLYCEYPTWSPDSTVIIAGCYYVSSGQAGGEDVYAFQMPGGQYTQLTNLSVPYSGTNKILQPQFTQDGRFIYFMASYSPTNNVVYRMNPDGSNLQTVFTVTDPNADEGYQLTRCRRFDVD